LYGKVGVANGCLNLVEVEDAGVVTDGEDVVNIALLVRIDVKSGGVGGATVDGDADDRCRCGGRRDQKVCIGLGVDGIESRVVATQD